MVDFKLLTRVIYQNWILLIIPIGFFLVNGIYYDFNGLYGQDSHEYLRYTKAIRQFLIDGSAPGDYFWPVMYPIIGALFSFVLDPVLSLQMISILSMCGIIIFMRMILKRVYGYNMSINKGLLCLLIVTPQLLISSVLVMSDLLAVFFVTFSFYYFLRYKSSHDLWSLLIYAVGCSLAFHTRYATAVILIIPSLWITGMLINRSRFHFFWFAILIFIVISMPHILIRGDNSVLFINHDFLSNWSLNHLIRVSHSSRLPDMNYIMPNIVYVFYNLMHPIYLFFGIPLLFLCKLKWLEKEAFLLGFVIVICYALFLAGIPFQNKRFLLLSFPFVVIILYPAFLRLLGVKYSTAIVVVLVIFQLALTTKYFKPFYNRNQFEQELVRDLKTFDHEVIYAFDIDVSFMSYGLDSKTFNLWKDAIDVYENDALLVYNEGAFNDKWDGTNVVENWNRILKKYSIKVLKQYENGWGIYRILETSG